MTEPQRRDCQCLRARHVHGTNDAYQSDRCRCTECQAAHRDYANLRRRQLAYGRWERFTPAIGTRRRLRALAVQGWTTKEVAARLDVDPSYLGHLTRDETRERVTRVLAERVARIYDELSMLLPAPSSALQAASVRLLRAASRERGWVPPLAWDDDTIDDPNATPAEAPAFAPELRPCGTPAAYRRHLRRSEKPCHACTNAARRDRDERRAA